MRIALTLLTVAVSLLATGCAMNRPRLSLETTACDVRMEPDVVNIVCGEIG